MRRAFGGRLRYFICGGAALKKEVCRFFHAAGILVLEGWGLTETFAAVTVNAPDDYHIGTVGKPLRGIEIDIAADGEILVRGPSVFKGYWGLTEETRDAFAPGGWFKTGDIGDLSRDGFLRIKGRKKEVIVTAGGKNIAPQPIEDLFSSCPYIDHFMVYGDGRKYLTALVDINRRAVVARLREMGIAIDEGGDLARHPEVIGLIARCIDEANRSLAPYETIKRFAIADRGFSVETGEITPTMKLRRSFIAEKYRDLLERLY